MEYLARTKWNYQLVKDHVEKLGFILISTQYIKSNEKLLLKDKENFLYYYLYRNLIKGINPRRFDKSNPYTIYNIKLWCELNNKPFELISDEYKGSNKKLEWRCLKESCGEIFEATWENIFQGKGCSYCAGQKVGLSNCLATKNPQLASEWHPTKNGKLTPFDVTTGSGKKVWWICKNNPEHEWEAVIFDRNRGSGCLYCTGQLPTLQNNLLNLNPNLCLEWNYEKNNKLPSEYTFHSGQYVWWKCKKCGHEW